MSLFSRVMRFARSPQGRRMVTQAGNYARSREGRARMDQVRRQITRRRKGPARPR
jgi:hypothetical protein